LWLLVVAVVDNLLRVAVGLVDSEQEPDFP
jgi:hypothetical protein